ncbi:MAG: DUF4288 domain-containing protein [Desulfobacterales bacterium]|nr:DUF4288 domain-containing protein [Desulfobacterales bacterium]
MDSVYVFLEGDFDGAMRRAIHLGRSEEEECMNKYGERVRWRLKEVISLEIIRSESLDGAEVYSEPVDLEPGEIIPFDQTFNPEDSDPTQTI